MSVREQYVLSDEDKLYIYLEEIEFLFETSDFFSTNYDFCVKKLSDLENTVRIDHVLSTKNMNLLQQILVDKKLYCAQKCSQPIATIKSLYEQYVESWAFSTTLHEINWHIQLLSQFQDAHDYKFRLFLCSHISPLLDEEASNDEVSFWFFKGNLHIFANELRRIFENWEKQRIGALECI
jgi:hypothetical protein